MKQTDIAYIAGVMDSDGYFTIRKSTYHKRIIKDSKNAHYFEKCGIKQVQPYAVQFIHKHFGGYYSIEKPNCKNGKPLYSVQLTNKIANKFIIIILPYLHIKRKQAQILIKLRKSISKGKTKKGFSYRKNRWGKITKFITYSVSEKEIKYKENLITQVKSLNDIRPHSYLPPSP